MDVFGQLHERWFALEDFGGTRMREVLSLRYGGCVLKLENRGRGLQAG